MGAFQIQQQHQVQQQSQPQTQAKQASRTPNEKYGFHQAKTTLNNNNQEQLHQETKIATAYRKFSCSSMQGPITFHFRTTPTTSATTTGTNYSNTKNIFGNSSNKYCLNIEQQPKDEAKVAFREENSTKGQRIRAYTNSTNKLRNATLSKQRRSGPGFMGEKGPMIQLSQVSKMGLQPKVVKNMSNSWYRRHTEGIAGTDSGIKLSNK
ncbi:CBK_G0011230.mRNA.1.CDS.1 [Saccharomyces cerevisiae]|nr:CBK_G0011230.mRNA.1.CDS.1 [Saccharomyces cerevisiae]CAI7213458.1 CBK_G0011230.mRNA.1.CDS.1 [Saccharomyces cerevisiae]